MKNGLGGEGLNAGEGRDTMKIIDAHLHFFPASQQFSERAEHAGHLATIENLKQSFDENQIVLGIGMGTVGKEENQEVSHPLLLPFREDTWPACFMQCLGIDTAAIHGGNQARSLASFEAKLKRKETVGIKVYAGYQHFYVNDPVYHPFYELAEQYGVPVVIHTGDTANSQGLLKYSHPLTVDEVAVNFPRVNFVMAHYGNPWIVDATETAKKNPNVYIDLSGMAEGKFEVDWFFEAYRGYVEHLRTWMAYLSRYDKLLYGSDWPLVHMGTYIALMKRLIPEEYHEAVFFDNAQRVFKRIGMWDGLAGETIGKEGR